MLPDPLLRSIVQVDPADPPATLAQNLLALRHELEAPGIDGDIVRQISHVYDLARAVPSLALVIGHFEHLEEHGDGRGMPAVARLTTLARGPLLGPTDFRATLDTYKDVLLRESLSTVLHDAASILTTGMPARVREGNQWQTQQVIGPHAALQHLTTQAAELRRMLKTGGEEGDFRAEGERFKRQYEAAASGGAPRRVLTGLKKIDEVHGGAGLGDLVLVLGFTAQYKSTFCLNWVHKAAVDFGLNVAIASIEMSTDQLRTVLYTIHSAHKRFDAIRGSCVIDPKRVEEGTLSAAEREFLFEVVRDFGENPAYGRIYYKGHGGESITMGDIKVWAETQHRKAPLSVLLVDYLGLLDLGPGQIGLERREYLNTVIRQGKVAAENFANGEGIVLLSPWQANREGYKAAIKNGGRYDMTAMSDANQAERTTDFIYYVYLDAALATARELAVGNIKARFRKLIVEQFRVFADPDTRVIEDLQIGSTAAQTPVEL